MRPTTRSTATEASTLKNNPNSPGRPDRGTRRFRLPPIGPFATGATVKRRCRRLGFTNASSPTVGSVHGAGEWSRSLRRGALRWWIPAFSSDDRERARWVAPRSTTWRSWSSRGFDTHPIRRASSVSKDFAIDPERSLRLILGLLLRFAGLVLSPPLLAARSWARSRTALVRRIAGQQANDNATIHVQRNSTDAEPRREGGRHRFRTLLPESVGNLSQMSLTARLTRSSLAAVGVHTGFQLGLAGFRNLIHAARSRRFLIVRMATDFEGTCGPPFFASAPLDFADRLQLAMVVHSQVARPVK